MNSGAGVAVMPAAVRPEVVGVTPAAVMQGAEEAETAEWSYRFA
jgi:hypothetical protein